MEKVCGHCKNLKPLSDYYTFFRKKTNKTECHSICKTCQSIIKYTKIDCICGKKYTFTHKNRHMKSNYHIKRTAPIEF